MDTFLSVPKYKIKESDKHVDHNMDS